MPLRLPQGRFDADASLARLERNLQQLNVHRELQRRQSAVLQRDVSDLTSRLRAHTLASNYFRREILRVYEANIVIRQTVTVDADAEAIRTSVEARNNANGAIINRAIRAWRTRFDSWNGSADYDRWVAAGGAGAPYPNPFSYNMPRFSQPSFDTSSFDVPFRLTRLESPEYSFALQRVEEWRASEEFADSLSVLEQYVASNQANYLKDEDYQSADQRAIVNNLLRGFSETGHRSSPFASPPSPVNPLVPMPAPARYSAGEEWPLSAPTFGSIGSAIYSRVSGLTWRGGPHYSAPTYYGSTSEGGRVVRGTAFTDTVVGKIYRVFGTLYKHPKFTLIKYPYFVNNDNGKLPADLNNLKGADSRSRFKFSKLLYDSYDPNTDWLAALLLDVIDRPRAGYPNAEVISG